jgi:hypothetical protein
MLASKEALEQCTLQQPSTEWAIELWLQSKARRKLGDKCHGASIDAAVILKIAQVELPGGLAGSIPGIWVAHALGCSLQLFSVDSFDIQSALVVGTV